MSPPQEYRTALLALALGSVAVLAASALRWGTLLSNESIAGGAPIRVDVTGTGLSAALSPLALVALAGVVGVLATARGVRRMVSSCVLLAGVGLLAAVLVARFGSDGHAKAVAAVTGTSTGQLGSADWNLVWLGALGGALLICAGAALVVVRGSTWATLPGRYERDAGAGPGRPPARSDAWSQLDRGEDPTAAASQPMPPDADLAD